MKLNSVSLVVFVLISIPLISFAQTPDANFFQIIAILQEQIRLLQEQLNVLILKLGLSIQPQIVQPIQPIVAQTQKPVPVFDLRVDGSDGPITIKKGESVTLSWNFSDHNWSYCNRFFGWDGGFKPINGSEISNPLSANALFKVICYFDSKSFEDSVSVKVVEPEMIVVAKDPSIQTASSTYYVDPNGGIGSCSLEVSPASVTMGKDSLEATWVIDSAPRQAHFYWRGKDNGVDIGRVYGGKTQRVRIFDYAPYQAKYERYVEMVLDSNHIIGDSFVPGCTTNTVTFEVK